MEPVEPREFTPDEVRAMRVNSAFQAMHQCQWRLDALLGPDSPLLDVVILIALQESLFLRARYLIEFFVGGGDAVHVSALSAIRARAA